MNIEELRALCLSLPHASEDVKWGNNLCFLIGEKMFCVTALEGLFKASMKVKEDEYDELSGLEGIIPAPYLARNKWILVEQPDALKRDQWIHYVTQSYQIIKSKLPKRMLKKMEGG